MTTEKQSANTPLDKIGGIQFLRASEMKLLRGINRLFIQRKKNAYRKDILNILSMETIRHVAIVEKFMGGNTVNSGALYNIVESLAKTPIITKHGLQREFPQYRASISTTKKSLKLINGDPSFEAKHYEFDLAKTNAIVKLFNSVDYPELGITGRMVIATLSALENKDSWFRGVDFIVNPNRIRERTLSDMIQTTRNRELMNKLLETDHSQKVVSYKLTEYGKAVIDVCNQVSQLLEKPNELQLQENDESATGILESAACTAD